MAPGENEFDTPALEGKGRIETPIEKVVMDSLGPDVTCIPCGLKRWRHVQPRKLGKRGEKNVVFDLP